MKSDYFQAQTNATSTMSYRSKLVKFCQFGAAGGLATALTVQLVDGDSSRLRKLLGSQFSVSAKAKEGGSAFKVNDLYHGSGIKWDSNWDKRY